jgi:hypothetical protein
MLLAHSRPFGLTKNKNLAASTQWQISSKKLLCFAERFLQLTQVWSIASEGARLTPNKSLKPTPLRGAA